MSNDNLEKMIWETFNTVYGRLINTLQSRSQERYINLVKELRHSDTPQSCDHLRRTLLHVAVEMKNLQYAKFLIDIGCRINAKEGCGLSPLSLSVLNKDHEMSKFLVDVGAVFDGPLFTSIPSPKIIADIIECQEIQKLLQTSKTESDKEVKLIQKIDTSFKKEEAACEAAPDTAIGMTDDKKVTRSTDGFITIVVGDIGTCKTNSAVMAHSSAFKWVGLCPGDLHNVGYFCEACFKAHGSSGLHYLLLNVLNRKKLAAEVFKDKKFNDNNLIKVREAIRDGCTSYALAAAFEFRKSKFFPSQAELLESKQQSGGQGPILLDRFKQFIACCCEADVAFKHRAGAFM